MQNSEELGQLPMGKLLIKQAAPAAIGFLIMSIYQVVDTIYVGHWIGKMAIAAITVVMPITFMIASFGMAVGIGGASIISRALGAKEPEKADRTLGNMVGLTLLLATVFVIISVVFEEAILFAFGAQGEIMEPAKEYFQIIVIGIPFLAWAMMSNNSLRAEGKAKPAMYILIVPAVANIILDPVFIFALDMGLAGAAWATTISYMLSAGYSLLYYTSGKTELKIRPKYFHPARKLVGEISAIGSITVARQGAISLLQIALAHTLFTYGKEDGVAIFGIVNRLMMFAFFPMMGVMQGFMPIAGYNYGAENWDRVKQSIKTSIWYGSLVATLLFILIALFPGFIAQAFTTDANLIEQAPFATRMVFLSMPIVMIQLISSAYFQAIGKAIPALLLTLTKQAFFLLPLVLLFPIWWDMDGVWYAFPVADVLAALVCGWYILREMRMRLNA